MAAQDAKQSPSSKEVTTQPDVMPPTEKEVAVATSAASDNNTTNDNTTNDTTNDNEDIVVPTYLSAQNSQKYVVAKSYLASGEFEQALELIEEAIGEARAILISLGTPDADLHECMAPYHYLYGTTLLYSIEESNDTNMTVGQTQPPPPADQAPADAAAAEQVEDMEIAWENLDTARNIVERMLTQPVENKEQLQLDLAQILLREGDLQRLNGRYSEAIPDYEGCLQIRQTLLPPFDRKIADVQYNLGLSYLSNSSELQKDENIDQAKLQAGQNFCYKGVQLYIACAKTLCGQIAGLCALEPDAILNAPTNTNNTKGNLKTTGLDEDTLSIADQSQTLRNWREQAKTLQAVEANDPRLDDLRELLDEIQETVDEAERSQQAVREAAKLKLQAQKSITNNEDGSTTTIGFDAPTMESKPAAAAAAPMMVVKKKKKAPPTTEPEDANPAKRPKTT